VAFYAVGAYSYALLAKEFGFSFWILLPLAGTLSAFWGILLGFPVLRLRGDYLAIVTLAFGEIIRLSDQLGVVHRRLCGDQRHSAPDPVRYSVQRLRSGLRGDVSASSSARSTARSFSTT
jgi:branched-subunit amino acid ABC-type transport system permease component